MELANLPGTSAACILFIANGITRKCFTLKMNDGNSSVYMFPALSKLPLEKVDLEYLGQGHRVQQCSHGPIRWQTSTSLKVIFKHFSLALTILRYLHFKICDVENIGQCHDIDLQ